MTFDFWWTLFVDRDGEAGRSVRELRLSYIEEVARLKGRNVSREESDRAFYNAREYFKRRHIQGLFTSPEKLTEKIFEELGIGLLPFELRQVASHLSYLGKYMELIPIEGAVEVLDYLKGRGYRIGLISDTVLTTGRYLTDFLRQFGLLRYFDYLVFSDRVEMVKPDRRIFLHAVSKLNASPEEAVHIGDFPWSDIEGALSAGFKAIQFTGANGPEKNNIHPGAEAVIEDLRDLCKILV